MYLHVFSSAENETKAKLEKVTEIKNINAQMMAIKSEISKYEDTLKEYQLYKKFLEALTPRVGLVDSNPNKRCQLHYLTHCGLVTPVGARDLGQHWLR